MVVWQKMIHIKTFIAFVMSPAPYKQPISSSYFAACFLEPRIFIVKEEDCGEFHQFVKNNGSRDAKFCVSTLLSQSQKVGKFSVSK